MNKKERFQNFINNKPVDRVPVAFFHHFCPDEDFGVGLEDSNAFEQNIVGHAKSRKVFDPDVIKVMNDTLMVMRLDTSFVKNAYDLRKIEPLSMNSEYAKKSFELTKRVLEIYSDSDAPKYITSFSPTYVLRYSLFEGSFVDMIKSDESRIKRFIKEDPESFAIAMKNISEGIVEFNRLLVNECGADGIYFSVNNQANFFDEEDFSKYIAPYERYILEEANKISKINLLHICGFAGKSNNLELFKEHEAAAYNWAVHAEGVSLVEGKKLFKGKPVFGGFDQYGVVYKGSKEEIEKATSEILDENGQIGIMLAADCTVPNDIDDKNLEFVRQAAIKYAERNKK